MQKWHRIVAWGTLVLVVAGHLGLWLSPRVPPEAALRLTLTNAAIWAVVVLPAIGVALWARAHRRGDHRR